MNNILSIDLDILFSPYIGIYNSYITKNTSIELNWYNISQTYDINNFLPNTKYLELIKQIILLYEKQVNKIYIGLDHDSILSAIELEKNNLIFPYKFNIYNIDYHHDIFYNDFNQIILTNTANCSNWVGFLHYNNYLNNYIWYYGQGSSYDVQQINNQIKNLKIKKQILDDITIKNDIKFDILFICISPAWIPPCYHNNIFEILSILPKHKIQYIKYPYFLNYEGKNFLNIERQSAYNNFNSWLQNI